MTTSWRVTGTFALKNENAMELSFPGAKKWWNIRSRERKWNFRSQSEYTHATQRSGIILYQARMSPKYSRNPRADFTQQYVTKRTPNYGDRRAFSGWSSGAVYEADVSQEHMKAVITAKWHKIGPRLGLYYYRLIGSRICAFKWHQIFRACSPPYGHAVPIIGLIARSSLR